jgi:hypothetical protein
VRVNVTPVRDTAIRLKPQANLASHRGAVLASCMNAEEEAQIASTPASSLELLRDEPRLLETLNRVGQAVAAELDLERVVQIVTDAGTELSGAAFGSFFYNRLDDKGETY